METNLQTIFQEAICDLINKSFTNKVHDLDHIKQLFNNTITRGKHTHYQYNGLIRLIKYLKEQEI